VYVFWYRGKSVVAYDSEDGRVQVLTEKGRETRSHLVIHKASPLDSGNYTCKPSIARAASIKVHVLESEFPDALHESGVSSVWSNSYIGRFLTIANWKMEIPRKSNFVSFSTLFSIAFFKLFACLFVCALAHIVLLNIFTHLMIGHHEPYDLTTTQKELFSCAAQNKKSLIYSSNNENSSCLATSNHITKNYNWISGNNINSNEIKSEKNKNPSNPFSITFNPKVGSALTFKHAGQSKLAQIPTNEVARKSTNLTTA
jgi:hypothetical protein